MACFVTTKFCIICCCDLIEDFVSKCCAYTLIDRSRGRLKDKPINPPPKPPGAPHASPMNQYHQSPLKNA